MGNRRYQIVLCLACILPALLFQTAFPWFPAKALHAWFDSVSDRIYPLFMAPRDVSAKTPSRVAIVEIDDASLKELGWPIDRAHYVTMLKALADNGRPPVLSLLHFQDGKSENELAAAIKGYGSVIGSSLEFEKGEELSAKEERFLAKRSLLSRQKIDAEDLPYLPLKLREAPKFLRGEKKVGTGARFGAADRVYCVPLYYEAQKTPGDLVIPSALVYAASELAPGPVRLGNGVLVNDARMPKAKSLVIEEQHCAPQASLDTADYMRERKLATVSFLDVVKGRQLDLLKGKLIVLASSDARKVKGPGAFGAADGITTEYRLAARLLDGIVSNDTVRRPALKHDRLFAWAPLIAGVALLMLGLWVAPEVVVGTSGLMLFAALAFAAAQLHIEHRFRIPVQLLLSLSVTLLASAANVVFERMVQFRHYLILMRKFREGASRASTLEELEAATQVTIRGRFPASGVRFEGRSPLLSGATDLKEAATRGGKDQVYEFQDTGRVPCGAYVRHFVYRLSFAALKRTQTTVMVVDRSTVTLGLAHLSVKADTWTFWLVDRLLSNVCQELLAHWDRIEATQKQKLAEYRRFIVARELDLGREVQSLLHPPSEEGTFGRWRYRFRYQPHGLMAGDWVQTFIPDGTSKTAILAIGDVVGKGTSAALITSAIAGIWLRHSRQWRDDGRALDRDAIRFLIKDLDDTIRELFKERQYSTLAIALLTEETAIVTSIATAPWMNVGVRKPKLVGKSFCDPLGVEKIRDGKLVLDEVVPEVGDFLIACTDGVMEGRQPQTRFMAQMDKLKESHRVLPLDLVEKTLIEHGRDSVLPDDKTLIILEFLSAAEAGLTPAPLSESA